MFKRSKKGAIEEQMYIIIVNIIALVIVFGIILNHIHSIKKDTLFDKVYLSGDLALLTNTIYSSPGNVFYDYSDSSTKINITKFDFSFKDGYVTVNEHPKGNEIKFSYAKELSFESSLPELIETPENIYFVKTDNTFSIDWITRAEEGFEFSGGKFGGAGATGTWTEKDDLVAYWLPTYNLNHISCPDIEIEGGLSSQSIVVDPGHGAVSGDPKDPGLEFRDYPHMRDRKEAYITADIANRIEDALDNVKLTRDSDSYETTEARLTVIEDNNADIVISIHLGSYSNNHNSVKAFIKYNPGNQEIYTKSIKLACRILNAFFSEGRGLGLDGVVIVPVDTSNLAEEDPMQVINFEDKVAVFLEIGNINTMQGRKMFNEISKTSNSIKDGLDHYPK
tara:strand:- start:266 stop:1444 length:1179 start_codon:yes stop_codon:yes gene_type:complete